MAVGGFKGQVAADHIIENDAECVDIEALIWGGSAALFGAHIRRRTKYDAGICVADICAAEEFCQAKIEQFYRITAVIFFDEHDVFGF